MFTEELPDVDCIVMAQETVRCVWNNQGTPEFNYTFQGWFIHEETDKKCPRYLLEKNTRVGCIQPYNNRQNRFYSFYTILQHGPTKEHKLKRRVKLNPPFNLTVKLGSDSNLYCYWNQTDPICEENEFRYRINNREWDASIVSSRSCAINLPIATSLYEVQVRGRVSDHCGQSFNWSDWSEPVLWGSNIDMVKTDPPEVGVSMLPWTALFAVGTVFLILLVVMLRHRESVRVILLPVVPKPSFSSYDIQDWLSHSKGLNDSFKPNYNERPCPVRDYCPVSQPD